MVENLNYGTYAAVTTPQVSGTKFCQNLAGANDNTCPMGGLYEWDNMMQGSASCNGTGAPPNDECITLVQGLCPAGWHIPSHYEWTTLEKNVGANPGAFPYNITTTGWLGTVKRTINHRQGIWQFAMHKRQLQKNGSEQGCTKPQYG